MTLRSLSLLMDRRAEAERRMDLRFGLVAAVIARANGAKDVNPADFFSGSQDEDGGEADIEGIKGLFRAIEAQREGVRVAREKGEGR